MHGLLCLVVNKNGAFSSEGEKQGLGFVVRDCVGKFVIVGSRSVWVGGSIVIPSFFAKSLL